MPTSRATLTADLRNCAEPAPVPQEVVTGSSGSIVIQGLNIDPSTGVLFAEAVNTGTVLTEGAKTIDPSNTDQLGTLEVAYTIANPQANDTYRLYLLGQCARKVFVGTVTIVTQ